MSLKRITLLFILTLSFTLLATNIFAGADEVKNEFVSVFNTEAGELCYRDMATDGDLADPYAASDAHFESALSKSLVKGDENNPPSELYIKRVGLQPIEKINETGLLIGKGKEIVHCDVIYPPGPAVFKARSDQASFPRELYELVIESSAVSTVTIENDLHEANWDIVRVTAISDEIILIELFDFSDPDVPYAVYELPRAYHQAWSFHSILTVIYYTDIDENDFSVDPDSTRLIVNTCALSAIDEYCDF